jgi:hypothetical protein
LAFPFGLAEAFRQMGHDHGHIVMRMCEGETGGGRVTDDRFLDKPHPAVFSGAGEEMLRSLEHPLPTEMRETQDIRS